MRAMLRLELLRCLRTPSFIISIIASPIVTSVVLGRQLVHRTPNGTGVGAYFLVSMATMGAVYAAVMATGGPIASERARGWGRQVRTLPGRAGGYLAGKLAVGAVTALLAVVGVLVIGGWVQRVPFGAGTLLRVAVAVWLGVLVFCGLGAAMGYLFNAKTITVPLAVLNWGLSFLGGLFWPVQSFPRWLRAVAEATPTLHLGDLAHRAQVGSGPGIVDVAVLLAYLAIAAVVLGRAYRRGRPVV